MRNSRKPLRFPGPSQKGNDLLIIMNDRSARYARNDETVTQKSVKIELCGTSSGFLAKGSRVLKSTFLDAF